MTSVYVSSEYLAQVSRIRNLLRFYRDSFLTLSYVDGTGNYVESAYDIWINLCLITSKVRPAFLVQWVDYMDPEVYQKIMRLLVHYRDNLSADDVDYRLLFLTDPQGIIVTTYYTYYRSGLRDLYSQYIRSHDDVLLGLILGYPAAGEISLQPGFLKYIEENRPPPAKEMPGQPEVVSGRYVFCIYAITYGSGAREIMSNIYRTDEARQRLNDFLFKIIETVKLYDSETQILISDTQQITDQRISRDNIYIERPRQYSNPSSSDIKLRDDFIKSPDREKENWNTDFDRIFELGYIYNR